MKLLNSLDATISFENAPAKTKLMMNTIFEAADFYNVEEIQVSSDIIPDMYSFKAKGECVVRHNTTVYNYSKKLKMPVEKAWLIVDYVNELLKDHEWFKDDPMYKSGWNEVKPLSNGGGHTGACQIKLNDIVKGIYKKINGYWKKIN